MRSPLIAGAVALSTVVCVFGLPFLFPPSHPSLSAAYTSGFNNRVATVAAALISLATLAFAWRSQPISSSTPVLDRSPVDRKVLTGALTLCAAFTLALGWLLTRAGVAYNDNLYFLEYMDEVSRYHLHIYKDFDFLYGPLLLYFPVALHVLLRPWHVGTHGSYYLALASMQLLGITLLYYTLAALPLSKRSRTHLLCLFTFCVLCPLLGLNYTLVRSLLPFSTLLFITRVKQPFYLAAAFFLGELLQLAVSPELGVAFAAGACFYAGCESFIHTRAFLPAVAAPPLAIAAFLGVVGKSYLNSISQFSSGSLNLIVEPLPYILFFLFAVVWLVPRMLGQRMQIDAGQTIPMLSLFVVSLALLPAAFGRCDPLHVFFNGTGFYLLAAVAVSSYSGKGRKNWFFALDLVLVWTQCVNTFIFLPPLVFAARVVSGANAQITQANATLLDLPKVERMVGDGKISTPFWIPYAVEAELKRTGKYVPDRDCFYIGVWDARAETARVERMRAKEWVLVPRENETIAETAESSALFLGFGFTYRSRHPPYLYGAILLSDLAANWSKVSETPQWTLYHYDHSDRASGLQ